MRLPEGGAPTRSCDRSIPALCSRPPAVDSEVRFFSFDGNIRERVASGEGEAMAGATRGDLLLKPLREWFVLCVMFATARSLTMLICPGLGGAFLLAERICQLIWSVRTIRWLWAGR
jgi:hypothetical protein